jgi:hypothetical protein
MVRTLSTPLVVVVGLVMLAAALGLSSTAAQAAPPEQPPYPAVCPCVVEVSVGEATPTLGDCIPITCKAASTAGVPVVDLVCTMSVVSPPGTDATVTPASVKTDGNGEATAQLCVGSVAGSVVVEAVTDCCGSTGQVEVTAEQATSTLTDVSGPVTAPPTGAGTGGGNSSPASLIAICSAVALAAGAVFVWQMGSRRRRSS